MSLKDKNSNSIDNLSAERAKALEAIEKYSFLNRSNNAISKTSFARYVADITQNSSNSKNDDIFTERINKSKPITFEPEEITGRSTALKGNDLQRTFDKTARSFGARESNNSFSMPSVDQMFATSICNSLNVDDDDFQPAELMTSKMFKDEMSFYEKVAHIPPSAQNKNETRWEEEIGTQVSFGDYFNNENSLLQKLKSPPKSRNSPFALVNQSNEINFTKTKKSQLSLSTLLKELNIDSTLTNDKSGIDTHSTYNAEKDIVEQKENIEPTESPRRTASTSTSSTKNEIASLGKLSDPQSTENYTNMSSYILSNNNDCESEYDKEYEEFLGSPLFKNRIRKRNKSRSKSPNLLSKNEDHLSSTRLETPVDSERFYNNSSPNNFGKMSLPTYELASGGVPKKGSPNSSLFSHRDGKKLPLKIDKFSIAWGSVKLRKLDKQSVQIKNVSPKRLQFRVNVKGPGFDVSNVQGNLITLQAMECRTIELSFCPTVLGLAVGSLIFGSPNAADIPEIPINLCGFGGHITLHHSFGVTPSPVGLPFLNLGLLTDLGGTVKSTFSINNKGTIHAFFTILVDQVGMDLPGICESICVKPTTGIIPPKGEIEVIVTYKATRNDLKRIVGKIKNKNALTIANLQILHGDEATRIRIKRMIPELKRTKEFPKSLDKMWNIPETPSVIDQNYILKESADSVFELIPTLRTRDISLTISNHIWDNDDESTILMPDVDETILFKTMIEHNDS